MPAGSLPSVAPRVVGLDRASRYRRAMQSLTIRAEDGRLMPMRFTDSQEIFWSHVAPKLNRHAPLWFIVLKARQVFSSTFTAALTFIRTLERGGANSLVVAHDLDTSHDLFNMAKRFYDHLPLPKIRPPKVKELEFSLPDGVSRYRVVSAGTMSKGRGTTQTCMHLSEVAFWPHPEVLTGMAQALPHLADTILVIESTANGIVGQGEMFHDLWQAAIRGESDYTPIFIPWWTMQKYRRQPAIPPDEWDDEERLLAAQFGVDGEQIQWRRRKIATDLRGVVDMFRQEFPACLVAGTRISTDRGIIPIAEAGAARVTESGAITGFFPRGDAPVFRATTAAGRQLVGTADHPLLQPDGTFVPLGVSAGRYVTVRPFRFADAEHVVTWPMLGGVSTSLPVTASWGRFLGYFAGDGCYSRGTLSIACDAKDVDVVEDVRSLMTAIFGGAHERTVGVKRGCIELRVGCVAFSDVMCRLGIWNDEKPHRRVCVPEAIFRSPAPVVREFLRGLFEADGFNGFRCNRVVLFSKHVAFLRDVQMLLLGFGVTSRVASRRTHNARYTYIANTLTLRSHEAQRFNAVIGFVSARKRARGLPSPTTGRPPRPIEFLDRVVAVEPADSAAVYDIAVEPEHVFSANGLAVHNSADESFVVSGIPAFDTLAVLAQRSSIRDPLWRGTFLDGKPAVQDKGEVRVWTEPIASHEYVIGADTAEGVVDRGGTTSDRGGDYACAEVLDAATCEQVASVHGRIPPYEFAVLLNQLGRYYNRATLCIEVYPQGHRVQDHLIREFYYPNLHRWRGKPDRIRSAPARLYGWETSVWSRPLMIGAGQRWINNKLLVIHEDGLLKELLHFSKNDDGKYEAQFGHDDRVMALLLALRSREENYVERHAMPVLSDPGFAGPMRGVRVADAGVFETTVGPDGKLTSSADASRRMHRILRDRARAAVNAYVTTGDKTWMTL